MNVKVYIVNLFFYNAFYYYYYLNDSDVLLGEDDCGCGCDGLRRVMKCLLLNCCEGCILL